MKEEALKNWYGRFVETLYNEANLDVRLPSELGRIHNYYITSQAGEGTDSVTSEMRYVYIPRDGMDYTNPPSEDAGWREYEDWHRNQQKPERSLQEINELYEMVKAGTLMILEGDGSGKLRPVNMDKVGNIHLGEPFDKDQERFPIPAAMAEPPVPAALAEEPPIIPLMPYPGTLSWIGHLLGIHTRYTDYLRIQEEHQQSEEAHLRWQQARENAADEINEYNQQKLLYEENVALRRKALQTCIVRGIDPAKKVKKFPKTEKKFSQDIFWMHEHQKTPLGMIDKHIAETKDLLGSLDWYKDGISAFMGPNFRKTERCISREVYGSAPFNGYPPYEIPGEFTEEEAALICFSALAHPDVTQVDEYHPRFTDAEKTKLVYSHVYEDLFANCRPNSVHYLIFPQKGRELGVEAMKKYQQGDDSYLVELFAASIRETMNIHVGYSPVGMGFRSGAQIKASMEFLERHKLLDKCGFTEEELREIRGAIKLHDFTKKALESRIKLQRYGVGKEKLTKSEIEELCLDVMAIEGLSLALQNETESAKESADIVARKEEHTRNAMEWNIKKAAVDEKIRKIKKDQNENKEGNKGVEGEDNLPKLLEEQKKYTEETEYYGTKATLEDMYIPHSKFLQNLNDPQNSIEQMRGNLRNDQNFKVIVESSPQSIAKAMGSGEDLKKEISELNNMRRALQRGENIEMQMQAPVANREM
ncbi:MAG: hypothetical protein Q4B50_05135 [Bacillota bacterium]|nr:hypothetical protein [Bacillota bacterium]